MGELEATMKDLNEVVTPAIQKLKGVRRRSAAFNRGLQYLVTRQNLLLNYSANISFYLLLRAEGKNVKDHPVLTHLLSLKKQMNKMEGLDEALDDQLRDLLEKEFPAEEDETVEDGMDQFFGKQEKAKKQAKRGSSGAQTTKAVKKQKITVTDEERAEAEKFYEEAARSRATLAQAKKDFYTHDKPELASSDDDSDLDGAKRGASYQIMKNKGLTAHKSKLNRNPRVKKRMQYRKAVIRRKGQVRDVRVGEAGKYGGETTGIKSNLSRSRKIRN
jgi:U3 small nucleolar RNA-associated protein 3